MSIAEAKVIVTCPRRNFVFTKITTSDGLYGFGDATLFGRELAVAKVLEEYILPSLIGRDPDRIEDIWQEIFRGTYWRSGPVLMTALAGVDMALWDIKGKRAGLPVYSLLGGKARDKVRIYRHAAGRSFEEVLDHAKEFTATGVRAIRAHVEIPGLEGYPDSGSGTWEPTPYLRTVPKLFKFLRENLGDEVDLLHDVHERLNPIQACKLAKTLEPFDLFFLEDPIRPEYKEAFRLIRSHTTIPLAMGELFHSKWELTTLLYEKLIDYVRVDLCHIGGITEAKKIASMAEPFYIDVAFHGPSDISPISHAANVHVDLAVPNFGIQEWVAPWKELNEVVKGGPVYDDGYLTLDSKPGLGTDVDEEKAKEYEYKRAYLPQLRRKDGSVADW